MDEIKEVLTRGVDTIYPTKEELEKVLRSGKKIKLYQGFDPTGDTLHIGHMVGLMKLRQLQKLGHHVIFLIGDFTAMIGDPTGKYSARKVLSHEQTLANARSYKEQAGRILEFTGENPAEILYNGDWLGKMSAIEFLQIARNITVSQLIERDMYQERIKKGQDIQANETIYPIMQAYDSVHMNIDLEVGGTDQMFNMLMGRKLMRNMKGKEKYVMTLTLIEDSEGKKIGKTEGNAIALTDVPKDLFGKLMSFPDEVISKCLEALTVIPMDEVK
jgi:tyrosyl-tRNA synthetase